MITIYACVIPAAEHCVLGNYGAQLVAGYSEVHPLYYCVGAGTALAHQLGPSKRVVRHLYVYDREILNTGFAPPIKPGGGGGVQTAVQRTILYGRSTNVCVCVCDTITANIVDVASMQPCMYVKYGHIPTILCIV